MDKEYEVLIKALEAQGFVVLVQELHDNAPSAEEILADLSNLVQSYEYVEQTETNPRDDYRAFCKRMARRRK